MKKNEETLRTLMDRRLSFLDERPSCRPALMRRIAQEEKTVMKKKLPAALVIALVIVSLSVIALAAELLLSPRVTATRIADRALEKERGITVQMQTFFGREETELPDGTLQVTYTGAGDMEAPLGTYTVLVRDGEARVSWSHDGDSTDGGYDADAWGLDQLRQMMDDSKNTQSKKAYLARASEIYARDHADDRNDPASTAEEEEYGEDYFEKRHQEREAAKTAAMNARKLTEEEMIETARAFILSSYELTEKQISLLELYTECLPEGDNIWYETVNGQPCFLVEYLLDEEPGQILGQYQVKQNSYFMVYVNVETGVIEQYEYNSGLGGEG